MRKMLYNLFLQLFIAPGAGIVLWAMEKLIPNEKRRNKWYEGREVWCVLASLVLTIILWALVFMIFFIVGGLTV